MPKYVAAIDQGTTSTRFMIFDHAGAVVAIDQKEHQQIYPRPGWVEHDALEIWARTQEVVAGALAKAGIDRRAISPPSASPTSARRRSSGNEPRASRSTTPSSGRTPAPPTICDELAKDGGQDRFRAEAGLPLATYFSGPKISWILDNVPAPARRAESGRAALRHHRHLAHLEPDGRAHGGVHVTDVTNASRTMLMDLRARSTGTTRCWR